MQTSEKLDQIGKALLALQQDTPLVGMSGRNEYDRYDYAKLEDWIHALKPVLGKHGLVVLASQLPPRGLVQRTTKSGTTEHACEVHLVLRVVHAPSGQWVEIEAFGWGQDRADKAPYKATTGARKYALAMLSNAATSDDPERTQDDADPPGKRGVKQAPPRQAKPNPAAETAPDSPAWDEEGPKLERDRDTNELVPPPWFSEPAQPKGGRGKMAGVTWGEIANGSVGGRHDKWCEAVIDSVGSQYEASAQNRERAAYVRAWIRESR